MKKWSEIVLESNEEEMYDMDDDDKYDDEVEETKRADNIFKVVGKKGKKEYKSRVFATKEKANDFMKKMDKSKYQGLSVKSFNNRLPGK